MSGRGLVDLTLIAHEFGAHAAPGPLIATNVVALALDETASHLEELAGLLSGERALTWCTVPLDDHGRVTSHVHATSRGDEIQLSGTATAVEAAEQADALLVTAQTPTGLLRQALVPSSAHGLSVTPMRSVDLTRRFSRLRFHGVRVPGDAVVGDSEDATEQVHRQHRLAVVLACSEMVGAMQRGFDLTVEWAFDRYSFGRPLASYQALKHRFADMKAWLEASHAIADEAAAGVQDERADADELASAALAFIGDHGSELLQDCVQMHGGMGLTFEHDLHLFLRRHTLDRALYGTPSQHRQRLARLVAPRSRGLA